MKKLALYEKYKGMERRKLYQLYYDLLNELTRNSDKKTILRERLVIKDILDSMEVESTDSYKPYPYYNEPDFIQRISEKAEFFHQKNLFDEKNLENACSPTEFELGKHQEFLKNFINETTPYKGVLVFHGVGVGKTCTAITISNSFRDVYRRKHKKIICLVSENIKPGWMKQIYDPTKGTNQCTGDSFHSLVTNLDNHLGETDIQKQKKTKKLIKEFYDFYGYGKFSNMVKRMIETPIKNKGLTLKERINHEKQVIQSYFSDRLLIIDEVHNLRSEKESDKTMTRDVLRYLEKVIKYSKNLRLVLLSATPLFNQPTEITWILNLLLKNDNRSIISDSDLFSKEGKLTQQGKDLLYKKSRGYVSYLRGENPVSFPIRLYPDSNNDKACNLLEYPTIDMKDTKIPPYDRFLKLYKTKIVGIQKIVYDSYIDSLNPSAKLSPMERRIGNQILNMVYPIKGMIQRGIPQKDVMTAKKMYGIEGLRGIMNSSIKNKIKKYTYKKEYLQEFPIPCFDSSKIGSYSSKIKQIVSGIQQSKGIVFIYSEYISGGIVPLALALEHAGYGKYGNKNLWNYPEWKPGNDSLRKQPVDHLGNKTTLAKQAKYIILSGDNELSPNNEEEIKELVTEKNKYGESIKIILGTVVTSEGLDLKNIREVHILEPWFHIFRLEQIIGRAIRRCSHKDLPKEERNVTVYHHVGYGIKNKETIDGETYRLAEEKAINIGEIETILKTNAIDCFLNKGSNVIQSTDVQPRELITSRGQTLKSFDVSDKPMTKLCSFQEKCEYACDNEKLVSELNYDTFSINNSKRIIQSIQKLLVEMFSLDNYYSLSELETSVQNTIDCNPKVIYLAICDMIQRDLSLWNQMGVEGKLIQRGGYYLFQPLTNTDPLLPFYYRQTYTHSIKQKQNISLDDVFFMDDLTDEEDSSDVPDNSIDNIYKTIFLIDMKEKQENTFRFQKKNYNFEKIVPLDSEIILSHTLDSLTYKDKLILLKHLFEDEKITALEKPKYDPETLFRKELQRLFGDKKEANKHILYHFRYNLIKKQKQKYIICSDSNKDEIVGFYLLNTSKFYKQKESGKELDNIFGLFEYYLYDDKELKHIGKLENGKAILSSIKRNFNQETIPLFQQVYKYWGFSFKTNNEKHVLKITNNMRVKHKVPGLIINNEPNHANIKKAINSLFPKEFKIYESQINQSNQKHLNSKLYLCLLLEMMLRRYHQQDPNKTFYMSFDIALLSFIEE